MEVSRFRELLPEFSDDAKFPDAILGVMTSIAAEYINPDDSACRSLRAKSLEYALCLMAAHLYTLHLQRFGKSNPGMAQGGFIQSSSIEDVSVTKAQIPARNAWQAWLSQTPYGQALSALLHIKAAGGLYVGGLPERGAFRKVGGTFR